MQVPLTPIRCLYRAVDLYGRKTGVVCGDRRFTYAEFGERCERLAAGLLADGIEKGDRVAYLSFNNHQLLEGYFGVLLTGAIAMPLNVRLTPVEMAGIFQHAAPRVLFYERDFAPLVDKLKEACPTMERVVEMGPAYEDFLARGRMERPDLMSFHETAIGELFYTSGSTGTPKGVMLSHRTLYLHAVYVAASFGKEDDSVELHTIPLFHANGWGRAHSSTMYGLKQVMVRRFDPPAVLKLIQEERATGMALVPTMANALLNCPELTKFDLSSLRDIFLGGAASSPELISKMEKAFHCRVQAGYGLTETSPVASIARPKSTVAWADEEDRLRHLASTGWPVPGCEMRVVDGEMNDVPRNMETIGEIVIRGDMVMDGYYMEPEATAAVMTDGWLHTGDMAVWDPETNVQIVDRKKDVIISGGENISSIEVERAIASHPAVLETAVVSVPDPAWGEVPGAYVVLRPGESVTAEELTAYLRQRLAKFKIPHRFEIRTEPLPKTGTGKILKRELREIFWEGKDKRIQG